MKSRPLADEVAYVAAVVDHRDAVARVLAEDLELAALVGVDDGTGNPVPTFAVGRTTLALFSPGDAYVDGEDRPGVHHFALASDHLEAAVDAADRAGVPPNGHPRPSLGNGVRRALSHEATWGVNGFVAHCPGLGQSDIRRGGGLVERIDHIGIATDDCDGTVDTWSRALGFPLESSEWDIETSQAIESFTSDKYGVVHHARAPEIVAGVKGAFVTVGDTELEIIANYDPRHPGEVFHGQSGTTRQDQGAIVRFIERRGRGLHHIAFNVPDIQATLDRMAERGHRLIDRRGRPGGRGSLIGFVHPQSMGGLLIHFVQRTELP